MIESYLIQITSQDHLLYFLQALGKTKSNKWKQKKTEL